MSRYQCDFCTRSTIKPMTNLGDSEEKIFACDKCIRDKNLLAKIA